MDDVGNFQGLVHQGDVTIREVDRSTSGGREVVACADARADDQIVDDFTIDLGDHFVSHQVGQGALGVDVMDSLEVLRGFEGPGGLELTGDGADAITVDAQGDLGLEGVRFQVVLVVNASNCPSRQATRAKGDLSETSAVVEGGRTRGGGVNSNGAGELGAVADQDGVGGAVAVEADPQAGGRIVAVRGGVGFGSEALDHHGAGENRTVGQGGLNKGATGDGSVLATDFLAGVVGVQREAVVTAERLGGVLPHDLSAGNRLALGQSVTIADVENQAGRLAHRLNADEVVSDEARVGLPDQRQGEPGEVGDVGGGGLIFEDHRTLVRVPRLVLVLEDGGHEPHLLLWHFAALAEHWAPLLHELVLLSFVNDLGLVGIGGFGHDASAQLTVLTNETRLVRQHS